MSGKITFYSAKFVFLNSVTFGVISVIYVISSMSLVHVPNFRGVSRSGDRGGGDNSIQFINIGRVGDKSFKE